MTDSALRALDIAAVCASSLLVLMLAFVAVHWGRR